MSTFPGLDAQQLIDLIYDGLSSGSTDEETLLALDHGLRNFSQDPRFHVIASALYQSRGNYRDAARFLWQAATIAPGDPFVLDEFRNLVIVAGGVGQGVTKDFSLHSGERQTADNVDMIRRDHRVRYEFAGRWLRDRFRGERNIFGVDIFSGNGYGSRIVHAATGFRVLGIDGSEDAVALANRAFSNHRVAFLSAVFPFSLQEDFCDFAISFESMEHVEDTERLLIELARTTSGPLIVSVPHEPGLPFATLGTRFEHHFRHFQEEEIVALLKAAGRSKVQVKHGQQVYRIDNGIMTGILPPNQMSLHPFDKRNSQFLVVIAE